MNFFVIIIIIIMMCIKVMTKLYFENNFRFR